MSLSAMTAAQTEPASHLTQVRYPNTLRSIDSLLEAAVLSSAGLAMQSPTDFPAQPFRWACIWWRHFPVQRWHTFLAANFDSVQHSCCSVAVAARRKWCCQTHRLSSNCTLTHSPLSGFSITGMVTLASLEALLRVQASRTTRHLPMHPSVRA